MGLGLFHYSRNLQYIVHEDLSKLHNACKHTTEDRRVLQFSLLMHCGIYPLESITTLVYHHP